MKYVSFEKVIKKPYDEMKTNLAHPGISKQNHTMHCSTPIHTGRPGIHRIALPRWYLLVGALMLIMVSLPAFAGAQDDPTQIIGRIRQAIEAGDADAVASQSSDYVEVSLLGKSTLISRVQSAYILKAFFRDHPSSGFTIERRLRVGRDWYIRGRYRSTDDDAPFQLEIQIRWNEERYEIKSILIDYLER